jgi:hypothetical protein
VAPPWRRCMVWEPFLINMAISNISNKSLTTQLTGHYGQGIPCLNWLLLSIRHLQSHRSLWLSSSKSSIDVKISTAV